MSEYDIVTGSESPGIISQELIRTKFMKNSSQEISLVKINPIVEKAKGLKIKGPEDMSNSVSMLTQCNQYLDKLTEEKEKLTKPLNATLKEVRLRYKPAEDILEKAIDYLRSEQSRYQTEAMNKRLAEEKAIADRIGEGKGKLKIETAMKKIDGLDVVDGKIDVNNGSVSFMAQDQFEVMDITMLPQEYILPNEVKIRLAMKAGEKLPGVRYFTIQVPRNTR